jgi:hypothetical protein
LCDTPPSGPKWVHEIKYDGYRMQARIDGQDIRLLTRKKLDWTKRFRSIAVALEELRVASALLDGEIVVENANGISSFNDLQSVPESRPSGPLPVPRLRHALLRWIRLDAGDLDRPQGAAPGAAQESPGRFADPVQRAPRRGRANNV